MDQKNLKRGLDSKIKEIEKYVKFFVLKSLQAVIMSRSGSKNKTKCNPSAKGQDWFNISLPESESNRRLQSRVREIFGKRIPSLASAVSLDIVLKTFEGTYMVLETWQFNTDIGSKQSQYKNHFSIYNRLGVLLKSIVIISRILPSFNLSRKPEKDFQLFFKIHTDIYSLHQFELHNTISVGSVETPIGKLEAKVIYRSKVWLSGSFQPHTYKITDAETLIPLSPEIENSKATFQSIDMFESELANAVSDTQFTNEWHNNSLISTSISNTRKQSTNVDTEDIVDAYSEATVGHIHGMRSIAAFAEPIKLDNLNFTADISLPKLPPTPPFQSLFKDYKDKTDFLKENLKCNENDDGDQTDGENASVVTRQAEAVGFEDDFVLVELRPAFFSEDDSVGNLYRQCLSPPPLEIFSSLENEDKESDGVDLDTQLERYKKEIEEYQNFFGVVQ